VRLRPAHRLRRRWWQQRPGAGVIAATVVLTAVNPKTTFSGTGMVDGTPVTFSFDNYVALYDSPTTPAMLAGSYRSSATTNTTAGPLTLTMNADGTLAGSGASGISIQGTFTIPDPAKSAFRMAFTLSNPGQAASQWTGLGAAYARSAVPQLLIAATSPAGGFIGTFSQNAVPASAAHN
jgi:hypothetical protein